MADKKNTRTTKTTKTATKAVKTPKTKAGKTVAVSVHLPGSVPKTQDYPAGSTLKDVVENFMLDGYEVSYNGSKESLSTVLEDGAIVRAGVKTKNAF